MQHKYNWLFVFALTYLVIGIFGTATENVSAPPVEHYYERTNQVLMKNYHYYVDGTMNAGEMYSIYWETCNESVEIDFYLMNPTNYNNWKSGKSYTAPFNIQDTHVNSISLLIPSTGVWYFVFANQYNGNMSFDFVIDYGESSVPEYSSDDGDDFENGQILEPNQYYYVSYDAFYGDILSGSMRVYFADDSLTVAILNEKAYSLWIEGEEVTTEWVEIDQNSLNFEYEFSAGGEYYLIFYNAGNETVTFSFASKMEHGPKFIMLLAIGIVGGIVGIAIIAFFVRRSHQKGVKPAMGREVLVANNSVASYGNTLANGPGDQVPISLAIARPEAPPITPPTTSPTTPSVPVATNPTPVVNQVSPTPPSIEPAIRPRGLPPNLADKTLIVPAVTLPEPSSVESPPPVGDFSPSPGNTLPVELPVTIAEPPAVESPAPVVEIPFEPEETPPVEPVVEAPIEPPVINPPPVVILSPNVVRCAACGGLTRPDMQFCPECGTPINATPQHTPVPPSPTVLEFCSNCGIQLKDDMLFCPKCGTKHLKKIA